MIFWLVLRLEISYRVIISWRILVSSRECFEGYISVWWNIWVFHNSSFALRYFFMLMARPQCDTPLVVLIKFGRFYINYEGRTLSFILRVTSMRKCNYPFM
jgi:hypothetical protein